MSARRRPVSERVPDEIHDQVVPLAAGALDSHILGFTLWQLGHPAGTEDMEDFAATFLRELPAGEFPYLAELIRQHLAPAGNGDSEFEFGLDLILDGLERFRDPA